MPMKHKRYLLAIGCLVILTAALSTFYLLSTRASVEKWTAEKWNDSVWNDRQLLIRSFLKQYDLDRLTKSEIIDLLGNDTAYYFDFPIPYKTNENLVYDFGEKKGSAASNISLIIQFDNNENVASYELITYSQ